LKNFYLAEGQSPRMAGRLARRLFQALRVLTAQQEYSDGKAQDLLVFVDPTCIDILSADYLTGAELWGAIELMKVVELPGLTHYERLRGKRSRVSAERREEWKQDLRTRHIGRKRRAKYGHDGS
jgi:hypothetical protein